MTSDDEQSPEVPQETEIFEQGDEALGEEERLNPAFSEELSRTIRRLTRPTWSTSWSWKRQVPSSTIPRRWSRSPEASTTPTASADCRLVTQAGEANRAGSRSR